MEAATLLNRYTPKNPLMPRLRRSFHGVKATIAIVVLSCIFFQLALSGHCILVEPKDTCQSLAISNGTQEKNQKRSDKFLLPSLDRGLSNGETLSCRQNRSSFEDSYLEIDLPMMLHWGEKNHLYPPAFTFLTLLLVSEISSDGRWNFDEPDSVKELALRVFMSDTSMNMEARCDLHKGSSLLAMQPRGNWEIDFACKKFGAFSIVLRNPLQYGNKRIESFDSGQTFVLYGKELESSSPGTKVIIFPVLLAGNHFSNWIMLLNPTPNTVVMQLILSSKVSGTDRFAVQNCSQFMLDPGDLIVLRVIELCKKSSFWEKMKKMSDPFILFVSLVCFVIFFLHQVSKKDSVSATPVPKVSPFPQSVPKDKIFTLHSTREGNHRSGSGENQNQQADDDNQQKVHLKVETGKEKRRRRRRKGLTAAALLEVSSSQSGASTPSSPLSPASASSATPTTAQFPLSPHGVKSRVSKSTSDPSSANPNKPLLLPSATFPCRGRERRRSDGLGLCLASSSTIAPHARAPGAELFHEKAVNLEKKKTEFTYDIWGDHFSVVDLMRRSRAMTSDSESFFVRGPQTLMTKGQYQSSVTGSSTQAG